MKKDLTMTLDILNESARLILGNIPMEKEVRERFISYLYGIVLHPEDYPNDEEYSCPAKNQYIAAGLPDTVCPRCGSEDNPMRNVYKNHFCYCEKCQVCWYVGMNLFSGWHDETPEIWKENEEFLSKLEYVDKYPDRESKEELPF